MTFSTSFTFGTRLPGTIASVRPSVEAALKAEGFDVVRAHPFNAKSKHGFIDSQKMGLEVFRNVDPAAPLIRRPRSATCAPSPTVSAGVPLKT